MAYLSELLGREVHDAKGTHIGRLDDVLILSEVSGDPYPRIVALAVVKFATRPTSDRRNATTTNANIPASLAMVETFWTMPPKRTPR